MAHSNQSPIGRSRRLQFKSSSANAAKQSPYFRTQLEANTIQPADSLKLIGYWAPLANFPTSEKEPPWPDIRRAVRPGWHADDREQLVNYLLSGHRRGGYLGFSSCRFECRVTYWILGLGELTDGEWVWPEGLYHYVERHAVSLPEEFVASAQARDWKIPPEDELPPTAGRDHSCWLEWASQLPDQPEMHPPDPLVMDRFAIIHEMPDELDEDPNAELFWDIWDEVGNTYGRNIQGGVGDEFFIEHIAARDRDAVVNRLVQGLRDYGLEGKVKLTCAWPEKDDWQRDRDVVVCDWET